MLNKYDDTITVFLYNFGKLLYINNEYTKQKAVKIAKY